MWIVDLRDGKRFLAPWGGDPGRTCIRESAIQFETERGAALALAKAKRNFPSRDYSKARVVRL